LDEIMIVPVCCDLYADVVPAWEYLLHQHWPDCPYPLVFVTNSQPLSVSAPVHYIHGPDIDYGTRMRKFLSRFCLPETIVLLTMADYLLKDIDIPLVEEAISIMRSRSDIWHVRLRPMPPPRLGFQRSKKFGTVDKTTRYALSLQPGLWLAGTAHNLFRDGENPWDTEQNGSMRVNKVKGKFLSTRENAMPHINYYNKRSVLPGTIGWTRGHVPKELWPDACRDASRAQEKASDKKKKRRRR